MSVTTRTNGCTNPSFEVDAAGWAGYGSTSATIAVSTAQSAWGLQSLEVTLAAADGGANITWAGLTVGNTYTVSGSILSPASGGVPSYMAGVFGIGTSASLTTLGAFTVVSYTFTATATSHTVEFGVNGGGAAGQVFYLDACLFEAGSTVGTYFDGSFTDSAGVVYAWQDAAGDSASTATAYAPALALVVGDSPCPNVQITLTDLTPSDNTVNVWRTADGVRTAVRGARGMTVNGSTAINDYEAPLGRSIEYDLEVTAGETKGAAMPSASTTVASPTDSAGKPMWWIQDPLVPGTAMALSVTRGDSTRPYLTAAAVKNLEYDSDVTVIPVAGSRYPIAIGGQRLAAGNVPFNLFTNTADVTTQLRDLLENSTILLIRPPGTDADNGITGTWYAAIGKPVRKPWTTAFGGTLTEWQMTGTSVASPTASIIVPVWTYGDVQALWSTYQDAQTAYSSGGKTYLDVLKNPTGT